MTLAPRSGLGSFDHIHEIYTAQTTGSPRLLPREEPRHDAAHVAGLYEIFTPMRTSTGAWRRSARSHTFGERGCGLYGLNLIPLIRPKEITFFDVNPHQIAFLKVIRASGLSHEAAGVPAASWQTPTMKLTRSRNA